jgi:hypothetical protein
LPDALPRATFSPLIAVAVPLSTLSKRWLMSAIPSKPLALVYWLTEVVD